MYKRISHIFIIMLFFIFATTPIIANMPPTISADSAILMEEKTGMVLYEKNPDKQEYPASMTKIMTLILSLKDNHLNHIIQISPEAAHVESTILKEGEWITVEQLLYLMMLDSDNGAAIALGEYISGDIDTFSSLMNQEALQLGAMHTNFSNPNGMPNNNHYSTARDIAIIARQGLSIPHSKQIVSTKNKRIHFIHPQIYYDIENTNQLLFSYTGAIGIKTGWTNAAKGCLAAAATRKGYTLIVVIMHSDTGQSRFNEAAALLDYGFSLRE